MIPPGFNDPESIRLPTFNITMKSLSGGFTILFCEGFEPLILLRTGQLKLKPLVKALTPKILMTA